MPRLRNSYLNLPALCRRSFTVMLWLLTTFLLSGCIHYDVGVQFDSPNQGRIVQHLQLEERLTGLGGTNAQSWLETIQQQTQALGGKVEQRCNQGVVVTIPFSNNRDLETKFSQFFDAVRGQQLLTTEPSSGLPKIASNLTLTRSNLLLVERNRLSYDLDLRSLGVFSTGGNLLISPTALINLEFRLKTPWGSRNAASTAIPQSAQTGGERVWHLVPGELNHLEAVFWLPSPLGIGTLVIVLLVLLGTYLKYPHLFTGNSLVPRAIDSEAGTAP